MAVVARMREDTVAPVVACASQLSEDVLEETAPVHLRQVAHILQQETLHRAQRAHKGGLLQL